MSGDRSRQQAGVHVSRKDENLPVALGPDGDERAGFVDGEVPRDLPACADGLDVGEGPGRGVDAEGDQRV